VSVADGLTSSNRDSSGGNNSTSDMSAAAATAAAAAAAAAHASGAAGGVDSSPSGAPEASLTPVCTTYASSHFSHGLPCAKEVLSFLIDCIAQRRGEADASGAAGAGAASAAADDEYAIFGLAMVHRAILAGGAILQVHEVLLTLLHRELFAAMATAVSNYAQLLAAAQSPCAWHGSGSCCLTVTWRHCPQQDLTCH
jgi:hypothetical protein